MDPTSTRGSGRSAGVSHCCPLSSSSRSLTRRTTREAQTSPLNQTTISSTKITGYICPSESVKTGPWIAQTFTNYHASFGGPECISPWDGPFVPFMSDQNNLPGQSNIYPYGLGNLGVVDFATITDGSSNTALFSEKLIGLNGFVQVYPGTLPNAKRVSYQTNFTTDVNGNPASIGTGGQAMALGFVQACKSVSGSTLPTNPTQWSGACWNGSHAGTLHFNAYNHWNTPNGLSCVAGNTWGGPPGGMNDIITATSNHPGGVNVGFCDGSVKFMKDSISPNVWWAVGSRNQGEVLSLGPVLIFGRLPRDSARSAQLSRVVRSSLISFVAI